MLERYNAKHTPVPDHKRTEAPYKPGVIEYSLNQAEKEFLASGRLDLIPTAAQRGLVAPEPEPRAAPAPPEYKRAGRSPKEIVKSITAEMLQEDREAGLTLAEISSIYGVSPATISILLKRFGLT